MEHNLEEALREGSLRRQLNSLIVAYLRENNLNQAASAVASATMTPLNDQVPPKKLLELVAKGIAAQNNDLLDKIPSITGHVPNIPSDHARKLVSDTQPISMDFSCPLQDFRGPSKCFPKHDTRHISEHKNIVRCARFSPDGRFVATGSEDRSVKVFEVSRIKQMMLVDLRASSLVRPAVQTYLEHTLPINDLDFHPQNSILVSGAQDHTLKFFDFSRSNVKKAFKVIQETHNVLSVCFHPSGDFVLAGTDLPVPHLYDVNTLQCFVSAVVPDVGVVGAVNQVRYSSTGGMYVTASKDGTISLWDGVSAQCIRSIISAHGTSEATSATFTRDHRYVLSCGKDSSVKLWEVGSGRLVKQYLGATHTESPCQAIFNDSEEFVLCIDEPTNEVVIWDALTAEKVARWPSNHIGGVQWLDHSPTEAAFVSCGTDRSVRFWKQAR